MVSPPFLMSRPAPSPRSSQATRLVTSNAPSSVRAGFTALCTHWTSASLLTVNDPHCCQLPSGPDGPPPAGGGGGPGADASADRNVSVLDQGPIVSGSIRRARQKN